MDTHGFLRNLHRRLTGEELGHAGLDVTAQPGGFAFRGAAGEQPGRFQFRRHVGELELDRLMLGDRLAHGGAYLGVGEGGFERGPGDPYGARGDVDAADLEHAEDLGETAAGFAEQVRGRDAVVDVGHLDRLDALVAELADVPADA